MSNLLPEGYQIPKTPSKYMRWEEGKNLFRVLDSAIVGWEYWTEEDGKRKPNRVKAIEEVPQEFVKTDNWRKKAKHFWAFPVYNRELEDIQVLEVTQKKVMNGIQVYLDDSDWGDPKNYDFCVVKVKTGSEDRDVEYAVTVKPKTKLDKVILDTFKQMDVDMSRLYEGGHPIETERESEKLADEVAAKV